MHTTVIINVYEIKLIDCAAVYSYHTQESLYIPSRRFKMTLALP